MENKRQVCRVNLKLDLERDADLVAWLEEQPRGGRSAAIRQVLRLGLGLAEEADRLAIDYERLRQIVAGELLRALAGRQVMVEADQSEDAANEVEGRFGGRLDQMMGGLQNAPDSDAS